MHYVIEFIVCFIGCLGGLTGGRAVYDKYIASSSRRAIPSGRTSAAITGGTSLSRTDESQLLQAALLLTEAKASLELTDEAQRFATVWLQHLQEPEADKPQLLHEVGIFLTQYEKENSYLGMLSDEHRTQLTSWLDVYLARKR